MSAGRVVEYDTPEALLARDSAFRRLTGTQQRLAFAGAPTHFLEKTTTGS
jgi:hypothetical protein